MTEDVKSKKDPFRRRKVFGNLKTKLVERKGKLYRQRTTGIHWAKNACYRATVEYRQRGLGKVARSARRQMIDILSTSPQKPTYDLVIGYLEFIRECELDGEGSQSRRAGGQVLIDEGNVRQYLDAYILAIKCTCWPVR